MSAKDKMKINCTGLTGSVNLTIPTGTNTKAQKYKIRKNNAVSYCTQILNTIGTEPQKNFFTSFKSKKDDLADSLLQCIRDFQASSKKPTKSKKQKKPVSVKRQKVKE